MRTIQNQKGFGVVEILTVILIIAILCLGGMYVWNKQNNDASKAKTVQESSKSVKPNQEEAKDSTADWATYSNSEYKFSFKHPKTWVFIDNPDACGDGFVLFAADQTSLGRCGSESAGQMMALADYGDTRSDIKLGQGYLTDYKDITESAVTIDGVAGSKQTAIASGQEGVGVLPDGTKVVQYAFYTNGKTYIARYTQRSNYPDALSDFDTLVTKTLRFSE